MQLQIAGGSSECGYSYNCLIVRMTYINLAHQSRQTQSFRSYTYGKNSSPHHYQLYKYIERNRDTNAKHTIIDELWLTLSSTHLCQRVRHPTSARNPPLSFVQKLPLFFEAPIPRNRGSKIHGAGCWGTSSKASACLLRFELSATGGFSNSSTAYNCFVCPCRHLRPSWPACLCLRGSHDLSFFQCPIHCLCR